MITSFLEIFSKGGWLMIPLVVMATMLVGMLLNLYFDLVRVGKMWRPVWLKSNSIDLAYGDITKALVKREKLDESDSMIEIVRKWRNGWIADVKRRSKMIRLLAGAAPLLGLLGTVAGMLKTFQGLSLKAGVDSMNVVADGISEALVTTQTGLSFGILSIIGLYFIDNYAKRLLKSMQIADAVYVLESAIGEESND